MGSAAGGNNHRLRPEHIEMAGPHAESDGTGNPIGTRPVHEEMRHHDAVVYLRGGLRGGFGHDRLIALPVNHDLPLAFPQVAASLLVSHDRQTPLLELVNRGVDMPRDIVDEILPHQAHEITAGVAHVIFRLVLAPLHAHVAIDGRKTVCNGAASFDVRLFDQDDLEVASPISGFVSGPAAAKATADDENVRIDKYGFSGRKERHRITPAVFYFFEEGSVGSAATLSAVGSCARSGELSAFASGAA